MPYLVLDPTMAAAAPATTIGAPATNNGLNLLELEGELRARMGGRVDITPERYRLHINLAYVEIPTSLKFDELKASIAVPTVAGQHMYLLPKSVFAVTNVALSAADLTWEPGRPLDKTSLEVYRERIIDEGYPREYFETMGMLVVWPTPETADVLAVDFRIKPLFLVQDTDCPILGVEWHEGILLLARQKLFESGQEWEAAAHAGNEYVAFVRKKLATETLKEEGKVFRSSVPRDNLMLRRRRSSGGIWPDALD